jgi:hypothetical protein
MPIGRSSMAFVAVARELQCSARRFHTRKANSCFFEPPKFITPLDSRRFIVTFLLRVADAVELKTVGQARSARVH